MNKNQIDAVYDQLVITKVKYAADVEFYANAKAKREAIETKYLSAGRVHGKNAEQRKANLSKLVNREQQIENETGLIMQQTRLEYELAQIEVDRIRLWIRLEDINLRKLELDNRGK